MFGGQMFSTVVVRDNSIASFDKFLQTGSSVNGIYSEGRTYLSQAVRLGNLQNISYALKKRADIHKTEEVKISLLVTATFLGRFEVVEYLVKEGARVNDTDSFGNTCLMIAVRDGHFKITEFLLENQGDIEDKNINGLSPLLWATKENKVKILELLLQKRSSKFNNSDLLVCAIKHHSIDVIHYLLEHNKVNVNESYDNKTFLAHAVEEGYLDIVKILISKGANANQLNSDGNTPLAIAVQLKQIEVAKYLVGMTNSCKVGQNGKTPLFWAVQNQDVEMVKRLLDHGSEYIIDTVFLDAIASKNLTMVMLLIERGAVINPVGDYTTTPLITSLEVGSPEIAKYLIENGAQICGDFEEKTGKTPLLCAIKNQDFNMLEFILHHGAKVSVTSEILEAIELKNLKIVQLLNEKGAVLSLANKTTTPLMKSLDVGSVEIAKYLIESGASKVVDDLGKDEISYIVKFLKSNNFEMVKLLTDNGARLDTTSNCGQTALIKAIEMENFEMIKYFVEHGANVNQANKNQVIPLVAALNVDDFRSFQYLVDCGANIDNLSSDEKQKNETLVKCYQVAKKKSSRKEKQGPESVSNQEDANDAP